MAKKHKSTRKGKLSPPDIKKLAPVAKVFDTPVQPGWVKQDTGNHHDHGALATVRTAVENGHTITIRTAYTIEVDGQPFHGHLYVEEDGSLRCHATPYFRYASAIELMKNVVSSYPESFSQNHGTGHATHGKKTVSKKTKKGKKS